jgi:hypothetical protein
VNKSATDPKRSLVNSKIFVLEQVRGNLELANVNWIWKETAEVLGVLGVIASMIFVGVEIRQNTNAVHGATLQAVSQQSLDLVMAGLDNPELRSAFAAAKSGQLSPEQRNLMGWFFSAKLRADENRFRQIELGILSPSTFLQMSNHAAYRTPHFAEYWARNSNIYAADFQDIVTREYLPLSQPVIAEDQ